MPVEDPKNYDGEVLTTVSYTHLDVYKRQVHYTKSSVTLLYIVELFYSWGIC